MPARSEPRRYRSAVRAEGARATRRRIREAATRLFLARGYATTTIDAISAGAGVARRTVVLAYPTKADLLDDIVNAALAGEDTSVPLTKRDWFVEVLGYSQPLAALQVLAHRTAEIHARSARIHDLALAAAAGDHALARLAKRGASSRRNMWRIQALAMHAKGWLRRGIDADKATDVLWTLSSPHNYRLLVVDRGWTELAYKDWLVGAAATILRDPQPAEVSIKGVRAVTAPARRRPSTGHAQPAPAS